MAEQRAITEREVRRASREGAKIIDIRGAIITPGARTVARELGILFTGPDALTTAPPRLRFGQFDPTPVQRVTVAIGCDSAGARLKADVTARLYELEHRVSDLAGPEHPPKDSPDAATSVAREVASGHAEYGIVVDATGSLACIAANKVRGVRAAVCHDVTSAATAREHANANVLVLAGGLVGPRLASAIVETFLSREFAEGKYGEKVAKVREMEGEGCSAPQ
jgi:ribose 5-phosphate isomerase B